MASSPRAARRLLWRTASAGRAGLTVLVAVELCDAAVSLTLPAVVGHTLDMLLAGRSPGTWLAGCAALLLLETLCAAAGALLTGTLGAQGTAWLRRRTFRALLAGGPRGAAGLAPGDVVTRLGTNATEAGATPPAAALAVTAVVTPVGGLIALAVVDLRLAGVFVAGLPLLALLLRSFARASGESVERYQHVQGRIAAALVESLTGAATVAAAGTLEREGARVLAPLAELGRHGRRMWQVFGGAMAAGAVLAPLLTTVVLAVGGLLLASGALSVGGMLAAARYCALASGIGAVTGRLDTLVRGHTAAGRLTALLGVRVPPHGARRLPAAGTGRLELRGVCVRRGGRTVLDGVDLTVPGGATLAVVGRSGSGKSTLAAVAGRLAEPDDGEVLLDGVPLPHLAPAELRAQVGYAFERPELFGETVGDAIAFGPGELPAGRVTAATDAAGAAGFVARLPAGPGTPLRAAPLSGGERQRLGLARAFAHAGRLLILDDATSSLDTVTEHEVARALRHRVRPGTRLLVAHRPATAARADLVAWLDGGRVRALGAHRDLWADPDYRAVFSAGEEARPRPAVEAS